MAILYSLLLTGWMKRGAPVDWHIGPLEQGPPYTSVCPNLKIFSIIIIRIAAGQFLPLNLIPIYAIVNTMIVTVDTNVIFSALYSCRGASHHILKLILDEKIKLALSPQVYFEYLITGNVKDFKNAELKGFGFKIITPGDFYKLWEPKNE